jgi:hypothetical protein
MNNHFYILYKTTNKINGKFYIGVHQTSNINDGYIGSGNLLKAAVAKYGVENFEREVLQIFKNKKDAFLKEKELVTEELVKNKDCYNIKEGGRGGFDHVRAANLHFSSKNKKIIHNPITGEQTKVASENLQKYINEGWCLGFRPDTLLKMSESGKAKIQSAEHRKKNSDTKKGALMMLNPLTKKHKWIKKEETERMKKEGWTLPSYRRGKIIHYPKTLEQKSVLVEDLDKWLKKGWIQGWSPKTKANMKKPKQH